MRSDAAGTDAVHQPSLRLGVLFPDGGQHDPRCSTGADRGPVEPQRITLRNELRVRVSTPNALDGHIV